jgi:hypothetical protein
MRPNFYEVLGVDPKATAEQVERAYRFSLEMYGDAALATYSLLAPSELAEMRAKVEEAYLVLRDPVRRQFYDMGDSDAPASLPLPFPAPEQAAVGVPAAPPALASNRTLADPVTGPDLRAVRLESGVTLQEIAASTKIGVRFLEYIESDRFSLLPAPVYLRSFLHEYARAIGLEPRRTAESYMARLPR